MVRTASLIFSQNIAAAAIGHIIENTDKQLVRYVLYVESHVSKSLGDSVGLRDAEHWHAVTWSRSRPKRGFGSFGPLIFAEPPR